MSKFFNHTYPISFFCILLCVGCARNSPIDRNVGYFDPIFKKFDTTQYRKLDEGFAYLDSAFNAFPNPGIGDIYSYDSIKFQKLFFPQLDFVKALSYADSMIEISQNRITDNEIYAERYSRGLMFKGDCFRMMKRYDNALAFYKFAEEIKLKYVKDKCKTFWDNGEVGLLLQAQQKYRSAARILLKVAEDYPLSCNIDGYESMCMFALSMNNVGVEYLQAGMLDSAWYYHAKAMDLFEKNERRFPEKYAYSNYTKAVIAGYQAEVLSRKKHYSEAESIFKKSIAGTVILDRRFAQSTQAWLAKLYLEQGKNDGLKNTLNDLKHSLDTLNTEANMMSWLELKKKYFERNKQIDSAFFYQQKYDDQKDSIDRRNSSFQNIDVGASFENSKLKHYNETLEKDSKLKNLYFVVFLLIFVMVSTVAILIYYNLKVARKLNTQVHQKNRELEKAFASLEDSYADNMRIMRVVAHDLKNPISAIQNIMHGLLQKKLPSSQREMFEVIESSCGNSLSLIHDLLVEKKEQIKKSRKLIDIGNLLENCVQLLRAKADEKKQILNLQVEHIDVPINRQKIWRVMSNVINNAIKFSPGKSSIDIKLEKRNGAVLFSVHDNGIGIPENLKDKIFEMSQDARREGTEGEKSHGLGLSISKEIVEEHTGKIWFESKEGEGSDFYIELPASA